MPNEVLKCYLQSKFVRIGSFIFLLVCVFVVLSSAFKVISQGIDSVPIVDKYGLYVFPWLIPLFLMALVGNIQITEDKLSIVGLFRRRELLRKSIAGEFTVVKNPGFDHYYFAIKLKTGKLFRFSVGTKKSNDYVLKFLHGEELSPEL